MIACRRGWGTCCQRGSSLCSTSTPLVGSQLLPDSLALAEFLLLRRTQFVPGFKTPADFAPADRAADFGSARYSQEIFPACPGAAAGDAHRLGRQLIHVPSINAGVHARSAPRNCERRGGAWPVLLYLWPKAAEQRRLAARSAVPNWERSFIRWFRSSFFSGDRIVWRCRQLRERRQTWKSPHSFRAQADPGSCRTPLPQEHEL